MTALTYGATNRAAIPVTQKIAPKRKGFFARLLDALIEARMRQAHREISHHYWHLLPEELEKAGNRMCARNEDNLPFGGR